MRRKFDIVVEPGFDRRADRQLGLRMPALDGLRQDVRGTMPQRVQVPDRLID